MLTERLYFILGLNSLNIRTFIAYQDENALYLTCFHFVTLEWKMYEVKDTTWTAAKKMAEGNSPVVQLCCAST